MNKKVIPIFIPGIQPKYHLSLDIIPLLISHTSFNATVVRPPAPLVMQVVSMEVAA